MFRFGSPYISRIIPDKLHGFKNKSANVLTIVGDRKIAILQNMLLTWEYLARSFNALSSIRGYLLGRILDRWNNIILSLPPLRDNIDQISIRIKTHHLLVCFPVKLRVIDSLFLSADKLNFYGGWIQSMERYPVVSSFLYFIITIFETKKKKKHRGEKLVRFVDFHPPSVRICSTGHPHCSNERFSKSFCSKLRNSPKMSPIRKTERFSPYTLFDRSIKSRFKKISDQ